MKDLDLKKFGEYVKKLRSDRDMSAYELSVSMAHDSSYINKLEKGKLNPTLKSLYDLTCCLGLSLSKFFEDFEIFNK